MSKTRQFFALFAFVSWMNFYIWPIGLAFAAPLWFGESRKDPASMEILTMFSQNLFFVAIIGMSVVLPEAFNSRLRANLGSWGGTEFLATRAVDRHLVFRARAALFYVVVLIVPAILLLYALASPDLIVSEYDAARVHAITAQVSNATLEKHDYTTWVRIPCGNILFAAWNLENAAVAVVLTQVLLLLLSRVPLRTLIVPAAIVLLILGPVFVPFIYILHSGHNTLNPSESLFLLFTRYFLPWTALAIAVVAGGQLLCERWFQRMEL